MSFIATLTAVLMLGDQTMGIFLAALRDILLLIGFEAGRGDDDRAREFDAMGDDGDGRVGHREVDHHVGIRFADDAQRHADLADAGDQAGVLAEQRMVRRLQCGDDLKARIGRRQRGDALPHPAGGTVDGEFHGNRRPIVGQVHVCRELLRSRPSNGTWTVRVQFQLFNSIAWMISSRLFSTCTARLANAARLTPRLPRTRLNSSWSCVW